MLKFIAPGLMLGLMACAPQTIQTFDKEQAQLSGLCQKAMTYVDMGIAGSFAPYIEGACRDEAAIAKLAKDISSEQWLQDLIAKVRAL